MRQNIIFGCLFLLCCSLVFSAPAPPSPVCKINADVMEAIGSDKLNVSINSVSTVEDVGEKPCKELYQPGTEQVLTEWHNVSIESIKAGDVIEGVIEFSGDEFSSGVYLKDYDITSEADEDKARDENTNDATGDEAQNKDEKEKNFFAGIWSWLVNLF